jgi:proline dehydrogenase
MNSFETIVNSFNSLEDGEVIVATHNINTVEATQKVYKESNSKLRVCYGQLLGLADHLTWKLKSEGFRVYKYLPWAETEVMIAYMIRRAEELNQMRYPLDTQYALLSHELKWRLVN